MMYMKKKIHQLLHGLPPVLVVDVREGVQHVPEAGLGSRSRSEPGVFGSLEPEPLEKKPRAGAAWEKNQEPEPEKNLPAPQP